MKRFVSGIACGALLFAGVSVSADTIKSALIGKKVDGVATVTLDGKKLTKDAVVIEGTSYVPVRAMTDAIGGTVTSAASGKIELITKVTKGGASVSEEVFVKRMNLAYQIDLKEAEMVLAEDRRAISQANIDNDGENLKWIEKGVVPFKEAPVYQYLLDGIAKEEAEIAKLKAEIAALEAELAELK